ncbi:hypothetical protein SOVF_024820 [Spinacia oleracea]|nr:hypothetical protein SOVF_024820 [Spinacia oleracea]
MSSIIYQANVRDRFPVFGCVEVIQLLKNQIHQCEQELLSVHSILNLYRNQHEQQQPVSSNGVPFTDFNAASQLQLGMAPPINNDLSCYPLNTLVHEQQYNSDNMVPVSQNHSYSSSSSPYNSGYFDVKETVLNSMWIQQQGGDDNNNSSDNDNGNVMPIQSQLVVTSESTANQQDAFQDYNDMHPYFDTVDDRQSYIDSKETYDSSPESSAKDITQFTVTEHVGENELKTAAAYFSLTSVN